MKTNWPAFRCGCLILAGVVLGGGLASMARAQESAGATSTAAVISSVAITQEPQRAAIRVEGAGRLDVHASRMQNPERLVLDFSGARLGVQKTVIPGVSAPVTSAAMEAPRKITYTGNSPKVPGHAGKVSKVPAPRFTLPNELAQPSLVLASLHEKEGPARPVDGQQAA